MKIIALILFTFLFCITPALGQDDDRSVVYKLDMMRADRKHDEAIAYLNNLIQNAPNDSKLYIRRAEFLGIQNKIDEAISDVNHAIEIQPDKASFYLERAKYFNLVKNNKAVLEDVRTAISLAPEDEYLLNNGTKLLFSIARYEENIKIASPYISNDKLSYWAYNVCAENKFALKDYTGALEDSMSAIDLIDPAGNKHLNAIYASVELSNLHQFQMISSIMTVHLKDDKNIFNYYNRLFELFERKAEEAEKSLLEEAKIKGRLMRGPNAQMRSRLGILMINCAKLYEQKQQSEKAEELLDRLVQLAPKWNYYLIRAAYFEHTQKYQEAISDLTFAIEFSDNNDSARYEGYLYGYARFPPYLIWRTNTLIWRGDLHVLAKQDEQAILDYKQAIGELEKIIPANSETATVLNQKINLAKLKLYTVQETYK